MPKTTSVTVLTELIHQAQYLLSIEQSTQTLSQEAVKELEYRANELRRETFVSTALAMRDGVTAAQLAAKRECSTSRIHQMVARGERMLKHPSRMGEMDYTTRPPKKLIPGVTAEPSQDTRDLSVTKIPNKTILALRAAGIQCLGQLTQMTLSQLLEIKGIGHQSANQVRGNLAWDGLCLKGLVLTDEIQELSVRRLGLGSNITSELHRANLYQIKDITCLTMEQFLVETRLNPTIGPVLAEELNKLGLVMRQPNT